MLKNREDWLESVSDGGLVSVVRRWWYVLVLCPIVAGAAGFVIVQRIPSVYEATETIAVHPIAGPDGVPDVQSAAGLADSYAEQIRANPVLTAAARSVGMSDTPVSELSNLVQARRLTNTALVRVSAQNADPALAAQLANAIVQVFISQNAEDEARRYASTQNNLVGLVTQLQSGQDSRNHQIDNLRAEPASPERDAQIARLQDRVIQLQASQGIAARSLQDVQLAAARSASDLSVIDPAVAPTAPIRPNRVLSVLMSILAGIFAGLGIAWLAEHLDDRVRDPQDVLTSFELPTLARIPQTRSGVSACNPGDSALRASFRELRSKLLVALGDQQAPIVAVASARDGDGKSAVAANLAAVLAHTGRRVILVDADTAGPAQAGLFNINSEPGLSTLLSDHARHVPDALQPTCITNLQVLTAGAARFDESDPSALLLSKRLPEVLEELRGMCDVLIVDTPALLAQPEGASLTARTDAVLLVLDARHARKRGIEPAVAALRELGTTVIGVVLNRVPGGSVPGGSRPVDTPVDQPEANPLSRPATRARRPGKVARPRGIVGPATDS